MKIVIGARASGKTTEAIRESYESGAMIVVSSMNQVKLVQEMAKDMGFEDFPKPASIKELGFGRVHAKDGLIIDNAEMLLQEILKHEVKMVTLTGEMDFPEVDSSKYNSAVQYKYKKALEFLEQKSNGSDGEESSIIHGLVGVLEENGLVKREGLDER